MFIDISLQKIIITYYIWGDKMKYDSFDILVVTGLSGAGKSETINILEDLGGFCIDNLPPELIPNLIKLRADKSDQKFISIVIDVRTEQNFEIFLNKLRWIDESEYNYKILFLDCADDKIIRRFMSSNRIHPLYKQGEKRLNEYIKIERQRLSKIREKANFIIDTSQLTILELKKHIEARVFKKSSSKDIITLELISFCYKNGIPLDTDIVFDVRFIPNANHIERFKFLDGEEKEVQEYVIQWDETKLFIDNFLVLITKLIPYYIQSGKNKLTISIGCSDGIHNSVAVVNKLKNKLSKEFNIKKFNRDLNIDL